MASHKLEAIDRVNMLMVFVPYLIEHSPLKVHELATTFDIEPAQVRELISLLAMSGIPGDSGLYQHQDLFDINWDAYEEHDVVELWNHVGLDATPRFSAREAATLVAGLNYLRGVVNPKLELQLEQLLAKIAQGSSSTPQNITVDSVKHPASFDALSVAISNRTTVRFEYQTSTGVHSERLVSPLRIDVIGFAWYLRAWCHDRQALRTFRLDRLSALANADAVFTSPVKPEELSDELFSPGGEDIVAEVRTTESFLASLREYAPELISGAHNGFVRVHIRFAELPSVVTFAAKYAGYVEVLTPAHVRAAVATWAAAQLAGDISASSSSATQ